MDCSLNLVYIFKKKVDNKIISVMKKVEPDVVKIVKDDNMPSCISRFLEDMVHNFWIDITDLVRF